MVQLDYSSGLDIHVYGYILDLVSDEFCISVDRCRDRVVSILTLPLFTAALVGLPITEFPTHFDAAYIDWCRKRWENCWSDLIDFLVVIGGIVIRDFIIKKGPSWEDARKRFPQVSYLLTPPEKNV